MCRAFLQLWARPAEHQEKAGGLVTARPPESLLRALSHVADIVREVSLCVAVAGLPLLANLAPQPKGTDMKSTSIHSAAPTRLRGAAAAEEVAVAVRTPRTTEWGFRLAQTAFRGWLLHAPHPLTSAQAVTAERGFGHLGGLDSIQVGTDPDGIVWLVARGGGGVLEQECARSVGEGHTLAALQECLQSYAEASRAATLRVLLQTVGQDHGQLIQPGEVALTTP